MAETRKQLCTFMLDDMLCGIPVSCVQEVVRHREMTTIPLAPPEVVGLINLRGQIVTAIDLRKRLGLGPLADGRLPMNIVARGKDGMVSLLVDVIKDVVDINEFQSESPPEPMDIKVREPVREVFKLEDSLLLVLDAERIMDIELSSDSG